MEMKGERGEKGEKGKTKRQATGKRRGRKENRQIYLPTLTIWVKNWRGPSDHKSAFVDDAS